MIQVGVPWKQPAFDRPKNFMDGLNFLLPACKPRRRAAARRAVDTADAALKADVPALSNAGVRRRPDCQPNSVALCLGMLQSQCHTPRRRQEAQASLKAAVPPNGHQASQLWGCLATHRLHTEYAARARGPGHRLTVTHVVLQLRRHKRVRVSTPTSPARCTWVATVGLQRT